MVFNFANADNAYHQLHHLYDETFRVACTELSQYPGLINIYVFRLPPWK